MGLLLTKEEKCNIRDALGVKIPCGSYLGANLDVSYMAEIVSDSRNRDDAFVKDVMKSVNLWIGAFPKGSNIPNPSAHAARLFELLCEDSGLTHLGVRMILDKMLQTKKQVPSIAEIAAEVEPVKQRHLAFKSSYEQFMKTYKEAEQDLIKRLTDAGIASALSDILDFTVLIHAWHGLCDGYAFPGCDIRIHPHKTDKNADLILSALSKPRHENPLLVLFLSIIDLSRKMKGDGWHMLDLYQEIGSLYPAASLTVEERHFPDMEELIEIIIAPKGSGSEMEKYMNQIAYGHFSLEAMFE